MIIMKEDLNLNMLWNSKKGLTNVMSGESIDVWDISEC